MHLSEVLLPFDETIIINRRKYYFKFCRPVIIPCISQVNCTFHTEICCTSSLCQINSRVLSTHTHLWNNAVTVYTTILKALPSDKIWFQKCCWLWNGQQLALKKCSYWEICNWPLVPPLLSLGSLLTTPSYTLSLLLDSGVPPQEVSHLKFWA